MYRIVGVPKEVIEDETLRYIVAEEVGSGITYRHRFVDAFTDFRSAADVANPLENGEIYLRGDTDDTDVELIEEDEFQLNDIEKYLTEACRY